MDCKRKDEVKLRSATLVILVLVGAGVCDQRCRSTCSWGSRDESAPLYFREYVGRFETKYNWSRSQNVWRFLSWIERQTEEIGIEQCKLKAIGHWKSTSGFREKVRKIFGNNCKVKCSTVCSFLKLDKDWKIFWLHLRAQSRQALRNDYHHLKSELKAISRWGFNSKSN